MLGGFLVFPWMPVVLLVVARRFRRDARFRRYYLYTLATAVLSVATVIFFLVFVGNPGSSPRVATGLAGLVQRVQLLPFFTWIALVARSSLRRANASGRLNGAGGLPKPETSLPTHESSSALSDNGGARRPEMTRIGE